MTVSIFDVLATLPSGKSGMRLEPDELGKYLADHCNTDEDRDRAKRHALREELYRDGGVQHMNRLIEVWFKDTETRELRKHFVPYARISNALKRITRELATVYSEPAKRSVNGPTDEIYQHLLELVRMEERALEISRLLNLHRALLVGFRVRQLPDGKREPVLDIASPANARAVLHPNDNTLVVGWMIRTSYRSARRTSLPAWTLWTDHESIQLRENLTPIMDTYSVHGFGVCPWIPITLSPPAAGFWPGHEGEDLVAAHIATWFNNVLLLKEGKSATKQSVVQGDGATSARGQGADSEIPAELADGQSITTIDTSMDLSMFRDTADHVVTHAGLNYNLPPAVLTHQGTQSAEARELIRLPLKGLRKEQQVPLRRFERQLAIVMSAVLAVDLPAMCFDVSTWSVVFAESETPLNPIAQHDLFLKRRASGHANTIDHMMELRPGLTFEQATEEVMANLAIETWRNEEMRGLQAISGSLGASTPGTEAAPGAAPAVEPKSS